MSELDALRNATAECYHNSRGAAWALVVAIPVGALLGWIGSAVRELPVTLTGSLLAGAALGLVAGLAAGAERMRWYVSGAPSLILGAMSGMAFRAGVIAATLTAIVTLAAISLGFVSGLLNEPADRA